MRTKNGRRLQAVFWNAFFNGKVLVFFLKISPKVFLCGVRLLNEASFASFNGLAPKRGSYMCCKVGHPHRMAILTHLPQVPHICFIESGQHWFRQWLVAYSAPSHYLNQCWVIVNWTLRNRLQWNFNQNTKLFIHENASENIVCEMATILCRGRWVNSTNHKMWPIVRGDVPSFISALTHLYSRPSFI